MGSSSRGIECSTTCVEITSNAGRANIVYDAIYFIAGGLIFLYRKELAEFAVKSKVIAGAILLIATVAYFVVGGNTLTDVVLLCSSTGPVPSDAIRGVLVNPVAKFLGGISFGNLPVPHGNLSCA